MMIKFILFFLPAISILPFLSAGQENFNVYLQPSTLTSVPPVHSGAFAARQDKWIFIGGRIDGLHIMQSNQGFPAHFRNDSIFIVDPVSDTYKSAAASQLPMLTYGAVSSANMQYFQDGRYLYMTGGYGYEDSSMSWITFPVFVSVDLDCLIQKIDSGLAISDCFRQLIDSNMAVCGGGMEKIDSTYYLVFGHRFDGRYARPPSTLFTQKYTEEIRKFSINDDGLNLSISNYSAVQDTDVFHRRDFNIVPQIFPDGERGFTVFGGVFQKNADMPFLTPVDVTADSVVHRSGFNENLNQYTTATLPIYDSTSNFMHNVFFGGLSLYTLDTATGSLIQDTLIPFVSTISIVSRDSAGVLSESKLPQDMPALKGANAFFIPESGVSMYDGRILNLNALSGIMRVGYLTGGIHSDLPNVADVDPVSMSRPNSTVYEVFVDKTVSAKSELLISGRINDLRLYPNPASDKFEVSFFLPGKSLCSVKIFDAAGSLIRVLVSEKNLQGQQHFSFSAEGLQDGVYLCAVSAGKSTKAVRLLLNGKEK